MQVGYRTSQLETVCTDARAASRQYGDGMVQKIHLRIKQMEMSDNVTVMIRLRLGRWHPLMGGRPCRTVRDGSDVPLPVGFHRQRRPS